MKSRGSNGGGTSTGGRPFRSPLMQMGHYPNHVLKKVLGNDAGKGSIVEVGSGSPYGRSNTIQINYPKLEMAGNFFRTEDPATQENFLT